MSSAGLAQNASTSLRGSVTDPSGAVVPGASIAIEDVAIGFKTTATSNARGEYGFQQLTPGHYKISVTAAGFRGYSVEANLLVAQPATVNAALSVTENTVSVDVSATAETLNTTDASIGNAIDNETIMALPSEARNPQTLLALQPGVLFIGNTTSADSRNGVVSGARADQTNITLDGLDNNDQIAPAAFTGVLRTTLDSTEEFRVTTSNANADTGRSSGGQVNLVTKSGTNQLHGALYEYNRSSIGIANNWFNKSGQLQSGEANRPGKLVRNTYGISLGGPVKRDKIFLFGNYEGNRQNESVTVNRTVPTASLRAGNLQYYANDGSVVTLTPAQVAMMDPNCTASGTCPQGAGDDPAALAVLKQYPLPNGKLLGDGLNTASFSFAGAAPTTQNAYITRLDFNASEKHRFYARASMQNDSAVPSDGVQQFVGSPANTKHTDDSKGISANYTWTPTQNAVNNLRYGFIRQSIATQGVGVGSYVTFRSLDTPVGTTRTSKSLVPTHNIIDDFTYTKGKHTIQVGGNYRRFTYENQTDANSYSGASSNAFWLLNGSIFGAGTSLVPQAFGHPAVSDGSGSAPSFRANYQFAATAVTGLVDEQTSHFNYTLSPDGTTGNLLAQGAPVSRSFRSNEVEYYVQDTWRPVSNLTITAGIRHSILQTPFETNGQQVQPTIDIHQWFVTRGQQAALGNSVQPDISFAPAGQSRGGKPFYPMNWGNVAPRIAFVFSPVTEAGSFMNKLVGGAGRSSIRAGLGIYYDHFGQGLVTNYSRAGSYSLSSSITNPASVLTVDNSPRFTGLQNVPNLVPSAASKIVYPQMPSNDPNGTGFAITQGLDDHIKTPYSEVFNLSWQRELPGGFTFEADYVGRLGRHLLQQEDVAQPLDLVDPKSGMDYYTAGTMLSKLVDQGATDAPAIPYWENLFPGAKTVTQTATSNIYQNLWQFVRGNETAALYNLDILCQPACANGKTGQYWPLQYSSLYVTSSLGNSSYNAGQFILRHPMKHNVQLDISYTYSKSLDMGSDSENNPTNSGNNYGFILDGFNPRKNYTISDFNTTHLVTADWVLRLPMGRGQMFGGGSGRLANAALGGWYVTGIARASSGLPFGISDGDGWATNWEYESYQVQTGPIKLRKHIDMNGSPQAFDDPTAALKNMRDPYPGEAGERNKFLGDGYFDVDAGLHKAVSVTERLKLNFAWEVFNVSNSVRFDAHNIDTGSTDGTQVGVYGGLLTDSRRMQLSGRIDF